jgi:hypothetical protein
VRLVRRSPRRRRNRDPLRWCDSCYRSIRSSILERTALDIQYPTARGIYRRNDRSISNRDYALSCSKLAGDPETDVATGCPPLKHDDGLEASIMRVAAIDLELVRLNCNFVFPRGSHLISLDKFDVGIRVVDPDRGRATMFTYLSDTQCGLVVCRVCSSYLQNSRCRVEGTSFDVIEATVIVFLLSCGVLFSRNFLPPRPHFSFTSRPVKI